MANLLSTTVSGNLNVTGASYLGIIYDYDDNGYYLNPNGTSVLSTINVTNTYVGNAIYFNGGNNYLNWNGRINSNVGIQSESDMRAPIFYDSEDTNYYLDLNSTSTAIRARGGTLYGPNPTWGAYLYVGTDGRVGTSATVAVTNGNLHIDSQDGYGLYLNWYSTNNIYTRANLGIGSDSAAHRLHVHGTGYATSDFRAPIFYDSNDTSFYLDPNSSSTSLKIAGGIAQNNLVGRPFAVWGASGGATGAVVIKFPGDANNYGMVHAVLDIYEYNGNDVSTVIVGGHNWNGRWYAYGAQVVGQTNKQVRVAFKDGKYCIVVGDSSSSWSYGQVVLRKIQNGAYYSGIMDISGGYTAAIESDSYSWVSEDLRNLETPSNFSAGGTIYSGGNAVIHAGNISSQSVAYATIAGNSTTTSQTTFSSLTVNNGSSFLGGSSWFGGYGSGSGPGLNLENQSSFARFAFWGLDFYDWNDGIQMTLNNGYVSVNNYLEAGNSLRAPIFYDSQDTNYYVDPNGTSVINTLSVGQVYSSGWFRNYGAKGMYNQDYGTHFYSNGPSSWAITGSGGSVELQFRSNHQSTIRGYVYADTGNNIGFLNNGGAWSFRMTYDRQAFIYGSDLTIGEIGSGYTNIIMKDGDEGDRIIHCNSHRIGFLNQSASWGSWCEDNGAWSSSSSMYSPIYYDYNDSNYYLDPNASGTSLRIGGLIETTRSSGTIISHGAMNDAFGYNGSYGTYIGSPVGGTYYLYANGTIYDGSFKTLINSGGGQTIGGITYFSNVESLQLYGIRGRFTNEYIHLYNKVGIGSPNGWGQGEGNTPTYGLSTYGGMNIAYGNGATSSFNGHLRIDKNWGGGDYSTEQFTIRGTYPSIALRSTTHNNKWLIHNDNSVSFYYGTGVDNNSWSRRFEIPTDGNIWMSWANDYISNLLAAKQNASTAINTSNIGSQSVNYASSAGNADTVDGRHADYFYPNYTDNGYTTGDINGATAHQRIWGTDSVQNLIQFNPPSTVEFSLDGVNWSSTSISNGVFSGKLYGAWGGFPMRVGNNVGGWRFVRMTWVNFGYRFFSHFTLAHSTNGHSFNFVFQKSDLNGNNFTEVFRRNGISSWPGYTFTKHENVSGWWDTRDIRMVFELNHVGSADNAIDIGHIGIMGSYGNFSRLYDWDGDRNLYFPNNVTGGTFKLGNGFTISQGNSDYASVNSWINLQGAHGLFSSVNGAHIYPNNGDYGAWRVAGSRNGYSGIQFDVANGNVSLMVSTNSNISGFHNNTYGWQIKYQNGTLYVGKNTYGGGTEAVVLDSSNYTNYITNSGGGGGGIHILTKPQSGWKYSNYTDIYNSVTNFNTAGAVICSLFYPATDISVSDVFINVVTAAVNPTRGKIVIYADEDLGYPSTKVLESSALDLTTTGLKTFVVNFTFTAGKKYWLGFTTDDNDSTLRLTSPGSNANYIRHLNNINFAQQAMYVPTWPGDFNNIPNQNTSVQTTSNGSVTVFFTAQ